VKVNRGTITSRLSALAPFERVVGVGMSCVLERRSAPGGLLSLVEIEPVLGEVADVAIMANPAAGVSVVEPVASRFSHGGGSEEGP